MAEGRAAADHVHATMRIALLSVVGVVQFGLCLRRLVEYGHRPEWLAVAAFTALSLVTVTCGVWVVRRKPLPLGVVVVGTVIVLAASAAAAAALPPDGFFRDPHWSFGLVGWHLLLLLLDRVPVLLTVLAVDVTANIVRFLPVALVERAEVGAVGTVVLSSVSVQLAVLMITEMLRRRTRQAMEVAAERDRMVTRVALAEQWEQGQRSVFAGQLGVTLPLLADLADGVLDPRDDDTRRRCALAATQLRRLFAENDDVPDPLVHEVAACVDVAERRGVEVSLAVSGTATPVPADVRRDLTGPVVAALSAARARARVSVLRTDKEVRVAVVTDAGVDVDAAAWPRVEVDCGTYGEHVRMEARWRRTSR
ncbi:hypothetical protein F4560_003568 [Saccharothrix ecbatanensis]|uniref:Signal transduction histidine kinase n=1 Tax=Saccharothrix ecbatanensis TaxID=1105145 RepID=A0A7W9M1B1_9PSEU|nr:hypothetical protein [Saccharothrix ecbatanensis]MBB5803800.1 hypothetical protein [Saccharothrix ecbatanensis]